MLDTRLSNTATHADHWLSPVPGSEAAINLAVARHLIAHRPVRPGVRPPVVELGTSTCRPATRTCRSTFEAFERGARRNCTPEFTFELRGRRVRHRRGRAGRGGRDRRGRGHPVLRARLAVGRRREPRRVAGGADPVPASRRCSARSPPRAARSRTGEQVRAQADPHAPAPGRLAGPDLAAGVPAGAERDVVPAPALPRTRAAASSTPTSSGSTTRCGPTRTACPGWRC